MRLSLTEVDVKIFAYCFICPFLTGLSRVVWVGNGSRFAMFDCTVPDEVDGVAFIAVGDLISLVSIVADDVNGTGSMVADDVDGTGSMVADDVDGTGMVVSDDVAIIGLSELDASITMDES
ncbi:hypothetical protein HHI36_012382 [Cryptolaemus montrouzieri]|uniref:Uncharacterized protein n=1 Tax=Cryptolaemus montrouzieri TaxID=559131 RepID=A0ABD2NE29_9CUCU